MGLASGAAAQTIQPPPAADFVASEVHSDEYEIEAGHAALAQSRNPRVRAFPQQMIVDHSRMRDSAQQAAMASHLPAPSLTMSPDQAQLLSALQSVGNAEFDRSYARQQTLAHEQALLVLQNYAIAGTDPNLRNLAQANIPVVRHHRDEIRQIGMELGER